MPQFVVGFRSHGGRVRFLGHVWIFLDGVMRQPELRRHPPIEGTVLWLLVAGL